MKPLFLAMVIKGVLLSSSAIAFETLEQQETTKGLEIIEVTAQKRVESIQEVPISISAIGEGEIKKMGLLDVNDLGLLTPGLETNNATSTQTGFNIRGITTNDFGIGLDAAVAVYIDGVYVGRRGTSNLNFNDVERVEVLKGPQGTLFGRNSAAGAIHIITKGATDDKEGDIRFTLGSHDKRRVELSANFPINDKWNFRSGFNSNHRGGYVDVANSEEKYHTNRDWAWRGTLQGELSNDAELVIRADYSDLNQQGIPVVSLNTSFSHGDPFAPIEFDFEGVEKREVAGISAELTMDVSDLLFTSITAYRQFERLNEIEVDGSAFDRAYFANSLEEDQWQFSQEFRLTQSTDKFKWTAGLNIIYEDITQMPQVFFNTYTLDSLAFVQLGLDSRLVPDSDFGLGTAGVFSAMILPSELIGQLVAETGHTPEQVLGNIVTQNIFKPHTEHFDNRSKTLSAAIYVDGTYSLTDEINLTLGGRYTYDDKEFYLHTEPTNQVDIPYPGYAPIPFAIAYQPETAEQENDWSKFTPRVVVDYQWNKDLMMYLSYTEGFKAGGFNTLGEAPPVKEETVKNKELGLKSLWFEQQLKLNFAFYQYDYTNLQQLELIGQPIPTYNLRNVDAEGNGFELEGVWQINEDLILSFNYGHTDTEYTKWQFFDLETQTGTGKSKVGEPISGMPKDQANVRLDYYLDGDHGQWNFHLSYIYTGDRLQGFDGPELAIMPFEQGSVTGLNDDELNSITGYELVNGRVSWESDNHPIFVSAFITNALDEEYIIETGGPGMSIGSPTATPGLPRMYGVEFGMYF